MTHRIVMLGSFPPPVGGAALVNQMVLDALRNRGADVVPLDVSGPSLAHSRSIGYHVQRLAANLRALRGLHAHSARANVLYLVPDAGAGAWYTAGLVRASGGAFGQCVIHHHSCRYIEQYSRPIAFLTSKTRERATHVFLTEGMAHSFVSRYGPVRQLVATNAHFVSIQEQTQITGAGSGSLRLGHLSNLCADKGFFAVADTFDALCAAGHDATLKLAGPVLEAAVETRLAELQERHGNRVTHLGAVKGQAKRDFYRSINVFLFPTRFRQEAAPLVIYEALSAGVPVLATDRGVISELVTGPGGAVCSRDADFPAFAVAWISHWSASPVGRQTQSRAIREQIQEWCTTSAMQYDALLKLLETGGRSTP